MSAVVATRGSLWLLSMSISVLAIMGGMGTCLAGAQALDNNIAELSRKLVAGEYSRRGADSCLGCHDASESFPTALLFRRSHGQQTIAGSPFAPAVAGEYPIGLQCEACHGPLGKHGKQILAPDEQRVPMISFDATHATDGAAAPLQDFMCLACHSDHARSRWEGSAHEQADVGCADCHQIHSSTDPVRGSGQIKTCSGCHRRVAAQLLQRSSHPLRDALIGGNPMLCQDCHEVHGGAGDVLLAGATLNESCYACHAEKRGPFLWEHAPAAEDCSICHRAHGSNQPALLVRRAPQLCQGCHSAAGHRNLPQLASQLPGGRPSEYLLGQACLNCHVQVHGSNHPSGNLLRR